MSDDEFETTTLIYTGRRLDRTKCLYAYTDEGGKVRLWAKPLKRGVAIGGIFEIERKITDGDGFTARTAGPTVGQVGDESLLAAWGAEDKAVSVMLAKITNDRKRARDAKDPIEDAIAVLRTGYAAQRTIAARAAFADYVSAAMSGGR